MARATINNNGMAWTVIGRNERSAAHMGRFFFAARCSQQQGSGYKLHEMDRDIGLMRQAEMLRVFDRRYDVWELSAAVREICGGDPVNPTPCVQCAQIIQPTRTSCPVCALEQPPRHPATEWADYWAKLRAQRAA